MNIPKLNVTDYMPLRDVVFNTIRNSIITGELKPGARIMEVHLAEEMGVSRTPVREAIRKLELEGLVVMKPRKGTYVADITEKEILDVLEVRAALDSLATRLAAEKATQNTIKKLRNIQKQLKKHIENKDVEACVEKDVEFHDVIYKTAGNKKLDETSNALREQIQRYRIIYLKKFTSVNNIIREHDEIISAIENGLRTEAEKAASSHIHNQKESILEMIHIKNN